MTTMILILLIPLAMLSATVGGLDSALEEFPSRKVVLYYNPFYWLGMIIRGLLSMEVKENNLENKK